MRRALLVPALLYALPRVVLGQGALRASTGSPDLRDVEPLARVEGAPVFPGSVATSPIAVVRPSGARHGTYTIRPMPGVMLFSDSSGDIAFDSSDSTLLPITYSVPRTRPSGLTTIARIVVRWDDRSTWAADFEAEVRARRALRLALASSAGLAYRGKTTSLRFMLNNSGNAADTVMLRWSPGGDWQLEGAPLIVVVAPGETVVRSVDLRCPSTASVGEVHIAQVTATGRGGILTASAVVRVAYAPATSPGFVDAATTLFAGSSVDNGGTAQRSLAITSTSQVTPETEVSLVARHREGALLDPVLAEDVGGQTFRLSVHRNELRAAAGDVWEPGSAIAGLVAQGRGVDLAWTDTSLRASLLVARAVGIGDQNVGNLNASVATRFGRVGVAAMHMSREGRFVGDTSTVQSAAVTYALGLRDVGTFNAEVGAIRLQDASGRSLDGFAFDLNGERAIDDDAVSARLHVVPASPLSRNLLPTSAFVSVSHLVSPTVRALASGSGTWMMLETGPLHSAGMNAGASVNVGDVHATVLGSLRDLYTGGTTPRYLTGRGASLALSAPVWRLTFDGYAEHGLTLVRDTMAASDVLRGGVRWNGAPGWLWAGVTYSRSESGSLSRTTELSGAYRRGRAELQVGTNTLLAPRLTFIPGGANPSNSNELQVASFWSRLAYNATADLAVIGGTSYQHNPFGSPWRFSLGARQRLAMPLPVHRAPVARGVVFEDQNGNRRYDSGEPTIAGIAVLLGFDRVVTRQDGAFAFLDPALRGQALQLDGASVPIGYLLPPDFRIAPRGHVDIPLVRSASVTLSLFVDANADGLRNDGVALSDGIFVTLTDSAGRSLDAAPNPNGDVTFPAVLPGRYTVTIQLPFNAPRAATTRTFEMSVQPGERIVRDVPLPVLRREVRFNDQSR